jgi:SWI/SNF-related matrix-associated actin-dependent regulator of chromatin subfamily A3
MALTLLILQRHVLPDNLKIHVDHGQNRKRVEYLLQHDVVITTYQTLSSAWKKQHSTRSLDTLFSVSWHRIILDEGKYPSYDL